MKKTSVFILIGFFIISCGQQNKNVDYLTTFAKAYGYVKYFHPSDEAYAIDWNQFVAYGAAEINKCKSREDLIETLNALFKPIAPSVKFIDGNHVTDLDLNQFQPEYQEDNCLTYWQHLGVGFGMEARSFPYYSKRVTINCESNNTQLFDYKINAGETISKNIGSGVYCEIPLVLYKVESGTLPKADKKLLSDLKSNISNRGNDRHYLSAGLGNVIITFNVFQHFYPYFDVVEVNWEQELRKALQRSFSNKDGKEHFITLEKFTAPLRDGHIYSGHSNMYSPKIMWEWIEDKLVITKVLDYESKLQVGDVVTHIDGINANEYLDEIKSRISAATDGWLNYRAETESLLGPENTNIRVRVNGKTINLIRNLSYNNSRHLFKNNLKDFEILDGNTIYINLEIINESKINELLPTLAESNSIIFDVRGRPNISSEIITHLLPLDDTTQAWIQIPLIVYPDQERIAGFYKSDWREVMKVKEPYLGNKKLVFITDGRAISYAESFLGYIEGYNLATIIGQPSAGTNGDANHFKLIGGHGISFTGTKVLKHDGSQLHGIGILPDIYVKKTIKGVKEGRDEFLEKAIEIARNY